MALVHTIDPDYLIQAGKCQFTIAAGGQVASRRDGQGCRSVNVNGPRMDGVPNGLSARAGRWYSTKTGCRWRT